MTLFRGKSPEAGWRVNGLSSREPTQAPGAAERLSDAASARLGNGASLSLRRTTWTRFSNA